ncbi:hypothetical protein [uncultured Tenacibaculum sp.]|uniref:hypothetical protein n=1 Tax=uncultured Tenacibaculum sp. TaxID=174713 RepID=UPI00262D23E2|nr:hypothetical protein [uncultured Tenacibaculum sp.]
MKITYIFLLVSFLSYSQNKKSFEKHNQFQQKAMLDFIDKKYETALLNFQKAIDLKPRENVTTYFYATAAALNINNMNKAKELLIASIHQTNASKEYFLNFKEFDNFRNQKLFTEIENNYENYITEFYKNLEHPEIYKEIDSLFAIDQKARKNKSDWREISKIDSLNINRLIEITKKYGWQKKGWLLLWHQRGTYNQDNYIWNFFKPYIDKQILEGNIEKSFWTRFEDENSIRNSKKQIYGHYWGQFDQFPIKDIKNVDKRRVENGLPPLWYMEKIYGIKLPSDYKRTKL